MGGLSAVRRRAAVTGIGLVTPLGNDTASTWAAILSASSGVAPIRNFDASGFPVRIAAEVKGFAAEEAVSDRKILKWADRDDRFALAAAEEALRDAGVRPDEASSARWGCVVGSGISGLRFAEFARFQRRFARDGNLDVGALGRRWREHADPLVFCRSQANAGLSLLCRHFGIRGYAACVHTACASGGQAVGMALRLVRSGRAERVLAGGFDSMVNPIGLAGFCLLGALSTDNENPDRASRPFDRTRNGFVLGEGAGFLVIEEWAAAQRRGAPIYAELAGSGESLSSYRITDPHPSGDGPIQAMRRALADAGAAPETVNHINAHGTSTPMNDRSECAAIRAVFGSHAERVAVSSTKSLMGHLIAAAGAVEAALCALSIRHDLVPVSANLHVRDPACALDFVTAEPRRQHISVALSNSFGFGGTNSCLALRHPDDVPG